MDNISELQLNSEIRFATNRSKILILFKKNGCGGISSIRVFFRFRGMIGLTDRSSSKIFD